ncbi:MAG TPA: AsmA-like C-terminal region-containing protein [Chitinophagales bacterium]|nr:AsmA-like C-terminal region-containing protein [Chitinophagales bacterium]
MDLTNNNLPQPRRMATWKKVLIAIPLTLLALVGLAFVTAWLLEDKIKQRIVTEINQQVLVPVKVKGAIDFSLLSHFPYASITFKKVSIDDRLQSGSKKLISAGEVSFLCNIYTLFGNEIEFTKIVLRDGELNLYRNEAGKNNYEIIKDNGSQSNKQLAIRLKKAQIKNIRFTYIDKAQATNVDLKLKDVNLSGNFNDNTFLLATKSKLLVNHVTVNGDEFMQGRNITADVTLDVNKQQKKYNFRKGEIAIDESAFSITGWFAALKNGTNLDFKLVNEGKDIQNLIALLPEKYKAQLVHANGSGEYSINASVKGLVCKNSFPKIEVSAGLKNSEIKLGTYNKLLKNVNATATYGLDENGNDKLVISNFNCTLNDQPFAFKLTLTNLANPTFDFYANGVLHLTEVATFVPDSAVQDMEGTVTFNNFHLKGRKQDFTDVENSTLTGSGEFTFSEVEFRQNGVTYGNINGLLKYENQLIEATGFTLNFLSTDFNFTGTIGNLFPYIYNLSSKRRADGVELALNGKARIQTFNLTGIMETFDRKNKPVAQRREKINIREVFSMRGNIDVEVGRFVFRKMEFNDLKTNVQIANGMLRINHLTARAMAGDVRTSGLIEFTPDNSLVMRLDVTAVDLDIPTIFRQCENFGQTTLTDRHLKGTVSTALALDMTFKNYKDLDTKSLSAIVDFSIKNGELIKFEPLRAASKFIRVEELEDIRFADLSNTIKIANEQFDIPEFEIKTSALNLMFFGYHRFDNNVDYHFKINLHKLLAQKFNRRNQDQQYIENDPYEGVNIFLTMTGNLSNPKIKFDKAAVRNKVQADFKNEKQVLKDLLKNAPRKVDAAEQRREEKYFDVKDEPQFMEFEEEPK